MAKIRPLYLLSVLLLGVVAAFLVWRTVATNMADLALQEDEPNAATRALRWNPRHAEAHYLEGVAQVNADPSRAAADFSSAIRNNPADGVGYAALSRLNEDAGRLDEAGQAMQAAAQMAPRRIDVQFEAARFWFRQGDIPRAMQHLNVALTFGDFLRPDIFPDLLKLAEDPAAREATFAALLKQPVAWFPQFFSWVAAHAGSVDTMRALLKMQAGGPNVITADGLRSHLQRLQRENLWLESYLVWLNSLGQNRLRDVGNLFNGGFEEEITNLGFDWIVTPAPQVVIDTAPTYGTTGQKALRVVFRGPRIQFQHVYQYTMLNPGAYALHGRVRTDSLETPEGVRWSTYCAGSATALAHSPSFKGTDHWQHFAMSFEIPAKNCTAQMLRLELAGRSALDYQARGTIWLDELSVVRQKNN